MATAKANALKYMAAGWGLFTGTHLAMSHPPVRDALIRGLGSEGNFHGAYSAVSLACFLPTTYVYIRHGRGMGTVPGWSSLVQSSPALRALGLGCKAGAAVTFGQAICTTNNIAEAGMGNKDKVTAEAVGVYRVTRHPMFTAFALLGFGNILTRGFAGDLVYWAGFPLIWALGCPHQDMRLRAGGLIPREYWEQTSFLPFAAIAEGRNSLSAALKEFNKPVLVTSLVAPIFFL